MVNPKTDLPFKKDYQANSWFAIGHFEAEGHLVNWLYHIIIPKFGPVSFVDSNFSVYDETTGEYHYEDKIYPAFRCAIEEFDTPYGKGFSVSCPMGTISGNPQQIHVEAQMKYGKVNCTMQQRRECIYNAGTGSFFHRKYNHLHSNNKTPVIVTKENACPQYSVRKYIKSDWIVENIGYSFNCSI